MNLDLVTDSTKAALSQLRDPAGFQWTIVTILVITALIYANEYQAGRLRVIAAGLALWFADWINELLNCAVLHLTHVAPLWAETGPTSFQILVGLNIETSFMFLIFGLVYAKCLPQDRNVKILGLNNRLALALATSALAVAVELVLHAIGRLNWHWAFWTETPLGVPAILVFGYLWFFLAAAWAHDAPTVAASWRRVGSLAAIAGALAAGFATMGWLS